MLGYMKKIKTAIESGQSQVFLETPLFVTGFPLFDRDSACTYLCRQLRNLGYDVNNYTEYEMYVTWTRQKKEVEPEIIPSFINIHKLAGDIRRKKVGN